MSITDEPAYIADSEIVIIVVNILDYRYVKLIL